MWIEHDGKGEPDLPAGTEVQVKFRDGHEGRWTIGELVENWDHTYPTEDDITHYRVGTK